MAQSGNPGSALHRSSDILTQKCEGSGGLRSDGVGLRMTETEKYKLGLTICSDPKTSFKELAHFAYTLRRAFIQKLM